MQDKIRVLKTRQALRGMTDEEVFRRPEVPAREAMRRWEFSGTMIERFLRPLFGGILLDMDLAASSRMFEFVFRMLALGGNAVPATGMQAIPEQIAAGLPAGTVRLGARVARVSADGAVLESGETIPASAVVVATDGPSAAALTGEFPTPASRAQTVLYYDAPRPPVEGPWLLLDGESRGPATNVTVVSQVAPGYAPPGRHLVSAAVIGDLPETDAELERDTRIQMRSWFGGQVDGWRHLRTYRVLHAQPAQPVGALEPPERPVRLPSGVFVCGDHRDTASIQGAMVSGRRAADGVLAGRAP
jgi:phytoene dehydrogenase-like protein